MVLVGWKLLAVCKAFSIVHPYTFPLEGAEFFSKFKAIGCWFAILAHVLDTSWRTFVQFQNSANHKRKTAVL